MSEHAAHRYTTVVTSDPITTVQSYLYDHTKVITYARGERYTYAIICTSVTGYETPAAAEERAQYLAEYQAGRLHSGLHGAKVHGDRLIDAIDQLDADANSLNSSDQPLHFI